MHIYIGVMMLAHVYLFKYISISIYPYSFIYLFTHIYNMC